MCVSCTHTFSGMKIMDCHNRHIYSVTAGSFDIFGIELGFAINALARNYFATYKITDAYDEPLAYMEGERGIWFFGKNTKTVVRDIYGSEIFQFTRPSQLFNF